MLAQQQSNEPHGNGMYTSPKVSIDGLMAMADAAGAKPLITVNYGSSTASDAAAWVAYAKSKNYTASPYWEIRQRGLWQRLLRCGLGDRQP